MSMSVSSVADRWEPAPSLRTLIRITTTPPTVWSCIWMSAMRCVCSWTEGRSTEGTQTSTAPSPASLSTRTESNPVWREQSGYKTPSYKHGHIQSYTYMYVHQIIHGLIHALKPPHKNMHKCMQASTHTPTRTHILIIYRIQISKGVDGAKAGMSGITTMCVILSQSSWPTAFIGPLLCKKYQNMYSIGAHNNCTLWLGNISNIITCSYSRTLCDLEQNKHHQSDCLLMQ